MSGIPIAISRAWEAAFSNPYMFQALAFLVEDHKREAFSKWETIRRMRSLKLGVMRMPYYTRRVRRGA